MKTIKAVIKENPEFKRLINAVVSRIGEESIMDVVNHGADCGFGGFTYYSDTHSFAMRYRKDIVKLLEYSADMLGEEIIEMVSNFGVFYDRSTRKSTMDADERKDLYKYLGGGRPEQGAITNVMAWFALEEVCRMFDE
jgi:hypothetical protein